MLAGLGTGEVDVLERTDRGGERSPAHAHSLLAAALCWPAAVVAILHAWERLDLLSQEQSAGET